MKIPESSQNLFSPPVMKNVAADGASPLPAIDAFSPSPKTGNAGASFTTDQIKKVLSSSVEPCWTIKIGDYFAKSFVCGADGSFYTGSSEMLARINPENGQKIWEKKLPRELDTFPAVVRNDGSLYVCTTDSHVRRLDPDTGEEMWNFDMKVRGGAPVIGRNGTVYTQYDDDAYALTSTGSRKWRFRINDYMHSIAAEGPDGTVYATSKKGLYAIKPSGYQKWHYPVSEAGCTVTPDGKLYSFKYNESLASLDPATGKENWRIKLGEAYVKAGTDGTLFVEGYQDLTALDPKDGHTLWNQKSPDDLRIRAVSGEGAVILGSEEKYIKAVDEKDGHELWRYDTMDSARWGEAYFDSQGTLFISDETNIYALDAHEGKLKFRFGTGSTLSKWQVDEKRGLIYYTKDGSLNVSAVKYRKEISDEAPPQSGSASGENSAVVIGPGYVDIGGIKLPTR